MKGVFYMSERKKIGRNKMGSYLKIQILNLVIYFVSMCIFSVTLSGTDTQISSMRYIAVIYLSLTSFVSGFLAGIKERKNGIMCGILSALPFNTFFIFISLILNKFSVDYQMLLSVVIPLVTAAMGGIISVNIRLK